MKHILIERTIKGHGILIVEGDVPSDLHECLVKTSIAGFISRSESFDVRKVEVLQKRLHKVYGLPKEPPALLVTLQSNN